jgi:hypothetical protein
MEKNTCEKCGKRVTSYQSVNLGSMESGYRYLCWACANTEMAESDGVNFEHPEYLPLTLTDIDGRDHEFHFITRYLRDRVAIEAMEIRNGEPCGNRFMVISYDPEEDTLKSFSRLLDKMKRAMKRKHLEESEFGLCIAEPWIVRSIISSDLEGRHQAPLLIIDGREISWDDFGKMLMTFEGFQFKMEIYDISEEI